MTVSVHRGEVVRVRQLTARMRRITIGGDELKGFAGGREADERFRLLLPVAGEDEPRLPKIVGGAAVFADNQARPIARTFTVRRFDPNSAQLDFDIAIHPGGTASEWALRAQPGQRVGIAGPGGNHRTPAHITRHVLAGDHAALPAIATILERLPAGTSARVLIELEGPTDEQELSTAADLSLTWLYRDDTPRGQDSQLAQTVRALALQHDGRTAVWAAGEASTMRAIRHHLRDERRLPQGSIRVCGYWREDLTEDELIAADQRATEAARAVGKSDEEIKDAGLY